MTIPENTNKWVILTSGPTRAYFDRVRYIANSSTGALGARIADALISKGLRVLHIRGKGSEIPAIHQSECYRPYDIETVDDLSETLKNVCRDYSVSAVIHAMAVLDYRPERELPGKKSSGDEYWDVRLVKTPKISGLIRELLPDAYMAGFKLETGTGDAELLARAFSSLKKYRLDLVIANDWDKVKNDSHEALFIGKNGTVIDKASTKEEIAEKLSSLIYKNVFSG